MNASEIGYSASSRRLLCSGDFASRHRVPSSGFESMSNSIGEMDLSEEGGGELLFELGSGVYIGLLHLFIVGK